MPFFYLCTHYFHSHAHSISFRITFLEILTLKNCTQNITIFDKVVNAHKQLLTQDLLLMDLRPLFTKGKGCDLSSDVLSIVLCLLSN